MAGLRHACIFMSSNRPGFIMSAGILGANQVILDLENAVAFPKKSEARHMAQQAVRYLTQQREDLGLQMEITVRINAPSGPLVIMDLDGIVSTAPDVIRIPTVNTGKEVEWIDRHISKLESEYGLQPGKIKLHPMIETPRGLLNIREILSASSRIDAVAIGGEDYAKNSAITRTEGWPEMDYVRWTVVTTAQAYGIDAIDTVYMQYDDMEGFYEDTVRIRNMGFSGRAIMHPSQIKIVQNVFTPNESEINELQSFFEKLSYSKQNGKNFWISSGKTIEDETFIFQQHRRLRRAGLTPYTFGQFIERAAVLEEQDTRFDRSLICKH
ncbi:Citrate lyase subunit beta [compost metagenome]